MSIENRIVESSRSSVQGAIKSKNAAGLVEAMMPQLERCIPSFIGKERFARVLLTEFSKNPKLLECSQSSLLGSMMEVARLGLEFGDNTVHLVPYGRSVQVLIGYKGYIELARRSGGVLKVESRIVYHGDDFQVDYARIENPIIKHIPQAEKKKEIYCVYAQAQGDKGQVWTEIIYLDELMKFQKSGDAWKNHFAEMSRKTVIRRLAKQLPLSPEMKDAANIDGAQFNAVAGGGVRLEHPEVEHLENRANNFEVPAYQRRGVVIEDAQEIEEHPFPDTYEGNQ